MGFLSGRMSFERFRVDSPEVRKLTEKHVEVLKHFAIAQAGEPGLDETHVGFAGGDHLLDSSFSFEKNIFEDVLHCGIRIDTTKVPAALRKAWLAIETEALI